MFPSGEISATTEVVGRYGAQLRSDAAAWRLARTARLRRRTARGRRHSS